MRSFHSIALLALSLVGSVACNDPASSRKQSNPIYANAHEAFQDLLNALPEESLHAALNSLKHFQNGVFESDRHGVERVHNENPPLATKLIVAAVQDLKKRQSPPSNGTTQAPPSPPSSNPPPPPPPSSSPPDVIVPVPVTTTDSNGQATVVSSAIISEPTASVVVAATRTNDQGQTTVVEETKPAVIFTATNSAGSTFVTASAVDFAPTGGQVLTRTNAQGSAFVTTYTPPAGRVSKVVLVTQTDSRGVQNVVTSYTYVEPAGATPATTQSGRPGLQTNAAVRNRAMEAAMAGGAVGGVFALFL